MHLRVRAHYGREHLCKDQIGRTELQKLNYANAEKSICPFVDHVIISLRICDLQLNFSESTSDVTPQHIRCIFKKYWSLLYRIRGCI